MSLPTPPLARRLPDPSGGKEAIPDGDELLARFLDYVTEAGLTPYPAQEEAILELALDRNVLLSTPTGSGKSLVATAAHFFAMARGMRSFYTCPIKALVSEKFFALCKEFGPDNVGMLTGDASVNRDAPIICCTAEILANMALREGDAAAVDVVVMDEFHYYADRDRGTAWQVPLLALPQARFLLMSATMGDPSSFVERLTALTGTPTTVVSSTERPVPLDFGYRDTPLHETLQELLDQGKAPIYLVCFTQRSCAEEAQNLLSVDFCTKDQKKAIAAELTGFSWASPYGKDLQRYVRHGVGLHHAGLLPRYRRLVERLAQKGHLKIICGTDTLGVGVNIPIRTVVFTKLCKYDGEKTAILSVRDFQQIAGRAGRRGFDTQGSVVAQAPEHVIENRRMEQRAAGDKAKLRKMVKKKPPEKGYVPWDEPVFQRLVTSPPEPLVSRFAVTYGMLLNVLQRQGGGCLAMGRLLKASHDPPRVQKQNGRLAQKMIHSLLDAGVLEVATLEGNERSEGQPRKRLLVSDDLQEGFSLNQSLSLYALETLRKLDVETETYALDALTLVESMLEDPSLILQRQLDVLKTRKMAEMKAAGVEYEERIAELEKLDYPKPNKDFLYDTWNDFLRRHPWLAGENVRPKAAAREMYEGFFSFAEYVREYGLERSEGLLLRYLSDVYKALVQTVPDAARTPELDDVETFFGAIVRGTDASLLDEWEHLRDGRALLEEARAGTHGEASPEPEVFDVTRDLRAFTVLVRNGVFAFVRALAFERWAEAAELVTPKEAAGAAGAASDGGTAEAWTADRLRGAMTAFGADHGALRTDPPARAPALTRIDRGTELWRVEQVLLDEGGHDDGVARFTVDLGVSRSAGRVVLTLVSLGT